MTPAERMAVRLTQHSRRRVDFDLLAAAAEEGDSSLPTSPHRRSILAVAAGELVSRNLVTLPIGKEGWDTSAVPPLPRWVSQAAGPRPRQRPAALRAWVRELSFASRLRLSPADRELLDPINSQLRDTPQTEILPLAERSYLLYRDEKRLSGIEKNHLVKSGLLDITAHLRARPTPPPLAMFEIGSAPWMLIVENSATFASLREVLHTWPDRSQIGWLAYGSGDQLVASIPTAADAFEERDHPVTDILLYGDLDIDGLECGQQTSARSVEVWLPPVEPAGGLYQALLEMPPRALAPTSPERVKAAIAWLPEPIRARAEALLTSGEILRQEALPLPGLRQHLYCGQPLLPQLRDVRAELPQKPLRADAGNWTGRPEDTARAEVRS
ncbi:hypothetical protein [Kitasatospora sp. NPDC091276]|uniref:hypothetical protein n=1 Tax=Kitasatospora sp. NPDC091276 TaxID=3155300 RepID=UPI00342D2C2B